jgi:DNA invertase Pin-like site-specific DNA recombinase
MKIGYARVSRADDQNTAAQVKELQRAGCKKVFEENASGGRWDRPKLQQALEHLREGDILVVWKLDRLSRSLGDLLNIVEKIAAVGAGFQSLTESIDTTTAAGRMLTQILGSFAEFERAIIRERTRAGLIHAKEQGRIGGRKPKLSEGQRTEVLRMIRCGEKSAAEAARLFSVHRSSISRLLSLSMLSET